MNQLVSNSVMSINSLEIANLVGKRHDNVRRTIQTLSKNGVIATPQNEVFEEINNLGFPSLRDVFVFSGEQGKRDSIVVVAQLSPEFTAKLVDRWQELESKRAPEIPQSLHEALRLAADLAEQKVMLESKIAEDAPKIEYVNQYMVAEGLYGFRQVAKLLQVKETTLREFLVENKIMYRLGGEWAAYSSHLDAGRFQPQTGVNQNNDHTYNQHKFTAKGVQWISEMLKKGAAQ